MRGILLLLVAALLSCSDVTAASVPSKPVFELIAGDDNWSVLHDSMHSVTCWINRYNGGGFACLPDSALRGAGSK